MPEMALTTELRPANAEGIALAAEALRAGKLVAFPTETVYGLGADATNGAAVARIFSAKERPSINPLIVHVASADHAFRLGRFNAAAQILAKRFWPGPLTLVVPLAVDARISTIVTAGLKTIALRVPATKTAQSLLKAAGVPVAAPSANPSGRMSSTRASHVLEGLGGKVDLILDGGATVIGLESTIVGCTDATPRLLRPGGVSRGEIEAALGTRLAAFEPASVPTAPGQLASHYAPTAAMRLNVDKVTDGEALLAFGRNLPADADRSVMSLNLSPSGDMLEAAVNLFDHLHRLDASGAKCIAVMPIPDEGLGEAINDRLTRAAAPRA